MAGLFASALSTSGDSSVAVDDVCQQIRRQLAAEPTLAAVFLSPHHSAAAGQLARALRDELGAECSLGCTAESIVGTGVEIEGEPALSLWAAVLPETQAVPMHLQFVRTPEGGSIVGFPDDLTDAWPAAASLLVFGDPFTFPAELLLKLANEQESPVQVIGGMASGATQAGQNRLILDGEWYREGAVAVLLRGTPVRTVVSQGCRPIGRHFVITRAERNVIQELGGKSAYARLVEVYNTLPNREQEMLRQGLHVGRVVSEYQDTFGQGDFLVRNVTGVDQESGAVVIGDYVRPGQTVQFHLRDAGTADAELRQLLTQAVADSAPQAGLLFTCNGRGTRLFSEPHHDARAISESCGEIPVAGFFAAGELGPVGGQNFLHGFTASLALFS